VAKKIVAKKRFVTIKFCGNFLFENNTIRQILWQKIFVAKPFHGKKIRGKKISWKKKF
jgi:hypothetical protein